MRGTPLDHSCGRVARRALERRRVQQRCPRGFSGTALGRRPQNRTKGADPRTGNHKGETCFCPAVLSSPCPGLPVPGLSWFRVPGSLALPLLVPFMFLFTGRGRHVPAPSGRDAGSSSDWASSQEPELGTDPRTGFFQVSPFTQYVYIFSAMYEEVLLGFGLGYLVIFTTADDFTLKGYWAFLVSFLSFSVARSMRRTVETAPLLDATTLTEFPSTMVLFLCHAVLRLAGRDLSMFLMMDLIEPGYSFSSSCRRVTLLHLFRCRHRAQIACAS